MSITEKIIDNAVEKETIIQNSEPKHDQIIITESQPPKASSSILNWLQTLAKLSGLGTPSYCTIVGWIVYAFALIMIVSLTFSVTMSSSRIEALNSALLKHNQILEQRLGRFTASSVYQPAKFAEVNLTQEEIDEELDLSLASNWREGSTAADIELVWCSKQVIGFMVVGAELPREMDFKDFTGEKLVLDSNQSNQWSLFTMQNSKMCNSQNARVHLKDGKFKVKTGGRKYMENSMSFKADSPRQYESIKFVIKGYYQDQE